MNTKSLSFRQVCWAQDLFRIDYRQGKANGAADTLSRFPQRSQGEKKALRAENTQILHYLQSSLTNVSLSGLIAHSNSSGLSFSSPTSLTPLHQVFICGTHVLPQLRQFWATLHGELAYEEPYQVSIGSIKLRLLELQAEDKQAKNIRAEGLKEGWENIEEVLHHQGLPYVPKIIRIELISRHHDNLLEGHVGIEKT